MEFYPKRTVDEQAGRLPYEYQNGYKNSQLDRIEIDGCEIHGYFEYSFMAEKSFVEQPVRSQDGTIEGLDDYSTFLTPRLIIRYNMMGIEDYRNLMTLLKAKNAHIVTCYDIEADQRVTHEMYFAPTSMPVIYQRYLAALGIQEYSIELIGTNRILNKQQFIFYVGGKSYIAYVGENWLSFLLRADSDLKIEYSKVLQRFVITRDGGRTAVIKAPTWSNDFASPYDVILNVTDPGYTSFDFVEVD